MALVLKFCELLGAVGGKIPANMEMLRAIKSDHNNWVVPGYVMAGVFPGWDGANFVEVEDARKNLSAIVGDGINAFVSLCSELPAEEGGGGCVRHPYFPKYMSYREILKGMGCDVNNALVFKHCPLEDQKDMSDAQLIAILNIVMGLLAEGRRVFIHCAGGHGRTGMVVACLLMCLYPDMVAEDALYLTQCLHDLRRVKDRRCQHMALPVRSPNSSVQFRLVRRFAEFLRFLRSVFVGAPPVLA